MSEANSPIALAITFSRHLFLLRQDRVGATEVDDDVALFEALHNAVYELPFAPLELVVNDLPFGVAQTLYNILFGRLRCDAAEQTRVKLAQQLVADLRVWIKGLLCFFQGDLGGLILNLINHRLGFEELDFADFRVKLRLDLALMAEFFLGRRNHGVFEGADQNRLVDSFFFADLFYDSI